jgi:hypothetical protein
MTTTLTEVPRERLIELPVAEEMQMGMTLGMALAGFVPVSIYPRWNFLLLAMNGYSESDATFGLGVYIVLALLVSFSMGAGAFMTVSILKTRDFRGTVAVLIAVPMLSVIGAGLQIVCSIIGVLTAEFVRVHY